jgi:polysaccharide biosynthesis protein PslJ
VGPVVATTDQRSRPRRAAARVWRRIDAVVQPARHFVSAVLASDALIVILIGLAVVGNAIILPIPAVALLGVVVVVGLLVMARNPLSLLVLYGVSIFVIPTRYGVSGQSPVMLLGLVALGLWVFFRIQDGPAPSRRANPIPLVLVILLGVRLLQYANASLHFRLDGRVGAADRQLLLVISFLGIAMFVSELARTQARRRVAVLVIVIGTMVMAGTALVEFATGLDMAELLRPPGFTDGALDVEGTLLAIERLGVTRVYGTAHGAIEFAAILSAVVPLAAYLGWRAQTRWERQLGKVAVLMIVVALPLSVSRTGVVGFALAGVLTLGALPPGKRARAMAAFASGFLVLLMFFPAVADATVGMVRDFVGAETDDIGIDRRTEDYDIVWDLVSERPLLGYGLANHDPTEPRLVDGERVRSLFLDNQYLTELVWGGVAGLAAVVALPVVGLVAARRVRRVATDPVDRALARALASTVIVLAVTWAFHDAFSTRSTTGLFFVVLGLIGALLCSAPGDDEPLESSGRALVQAGSP